MSYPDNPTIHESIEQFFTFYENYATREDMDRDIYLGNLEKDDPYFKSLDAFENVNSPEDISIVHIGNAISAFISEEWKSMDSPFDDFLNGQENAVSDKAKDGMKLFFGKANCSHS